MDYAQLVEQYVQDAWDDGKTTSEIKEELRLKRWPPEMVDTIIERMIKQRVESVDDTSFEVNGPDFWRQPTWPVTGGWSNSHRPPEVVSKPKKKVVSKKVTAQRQKKRDVFFIPTPEKYQSPKQTVPTTAPAKHSQIDNLATDGNGGLILPNLATAVKKTTPQAAAKQQLLSPTPEQLIAGLQSKKNQQQKLTDKLAARRQQEENDVKTQRQALWVTTGLVMTFICALLWRFFVIK